MIIISEDRPERAPRSKSIPPPDLPLPAPARRAVRAAAAVARGEVDLDQATRRYGAAASLIEVWQHALQGVAAESGSGGNPGARRR